MQLPRLLSELVPGLVWGEADGGMAGSGRPSPPGDSDLVTLRRRAQRCTSAILSRSSKGWAAVAASPVARDKVALEAMAGQEVVLSLVDQSSP